MKDLKKITGYKIRIFINETDYNLLKSIAIKNRITIDEYIEKLIKNNIKK